jgi:hypothetical protein
MKNQNEARGVQQRFEAVLFLTAIALIVVGLNGNTPLIIVGSSLIFLVLINRFFNKKNDL